MRTLALVIGCLIVAAPVRAQDKKKEPTPLAAAIKKAHVAIDKAKATPELAENVVKASKALDGVFLVTMDKSKLEEKDGATIIHGTVTVSRGKDRYRTESERLQIAEVTSRMKIAQTQVTNAKRPRVKKETAYRNETEESADSSVIADAERHLSKVKHELAALMKSLNALADKRRLASEVIAVELKIPNKIKAKIDLDKMLLSDKVKLSAKVASWKMGTEPAEIGGAPRIASVVLEAVGE